MKKQEQEQAEEDVRKAPVTLATKIGIVALPMIPTVIIDLITHGGLTPPALTAFGLSYLAFERTPKVAAWLGEHKEFLAYLSAHPDVLTKLDRLTKGYFSQQLEAQNLSVAQPHEGTVVEQAEQRSVTQGKTTQLDDMEDLQPKPTLELTDDEIDEGLAFVMVPTRHEEAQDADGRVRFLFGSDPRRRLMMAENFQPDADAPLATGVAAFGLPGSGKTTTIVRFFEQYVEQYHLPFVAFDSQGDFKSLVESGLCPRGVIATPGNLPSMTSVIMHRLQVVIDLSEWREQGRIEMSYELAAQVIAASIRGLMASQKAIPSHDRLPCLVGLDEAQLWVPEGASGLISKETQQSIKSVVMALATTGRKLGVVPFVAGPRIAQIDKDAIAGIETRLFGKADLDNDIKRYREYIPAKEISDQQIRQLGQGELIVSMNGQRLLVHFYNRATVHTSHTPRVSRALIQMTSILPPETLAHITRAETREVRTEELPVTKTHTSGRRSVAPVAARRAERDARLRGTNVAQGRQDSGDMRVTARVPDMIIPEQKPEPTINDALAVWNEVVGSGGKLSRYSLREQLVNKGFECGENKARDLLDKLKAKAEVNQSVKR